MHLPLQGCLSSVLPCRWAVCLVCCLQVGFLSSVLAAGGLSVWCAACRWARANLKGTSTEVVHLAALLFAGWLWAQPGCSTKAEMVPDRFPHTA